MGRLAESSIVAGPDDGSWALVPGSAVRGRGARLRGAAGRSAALICVAWLGRGARLRGVAWSRASGARVWLGAGAGSWRVPRARPRQTWRSWCSRSDKTHVFEHAAASDLGGRTRFIPARARLGTSSFVEVPGWSPIRRLVTRSGQASCHLSPWAHQMTSAARRQGVARARRQGVPRQNPGVRRYDGRPPRPKWRNWQTRRSQTPLRATSSGFKSRLRHHEWHPPGTLG